MKIEDNNSNKEYKPISCSIYDELILCISRKQRITISTEKEEITTLAKDIYTREKIEYLLLEDGSELRLDEIKSFIVAK